jgi:hypothetical protein
VASNFAGYNPGSIRTPTPLWALLLLACALLVYVALADNRPACTVASSWGSHAIRRPRLDTLCTSSAAPSTSRRILVSSRDSAESGRAGVARGELDLVIRFTSRPKPRFCSNLSGSIRRCSPK